MSKPDELPNPPNSPDDEQIYGFFKSTDYSSVQEHLRMTTALMMHKCITPSMIQSTCGIDLNEAIKVTTNTIFICLNVAKSQSKAFDGAEMDLILAECIEFEETVIDILKNHGTLTIQQELTCRNDAKAHRLILLHFIKSIY